MNAFNTVNLAAACILTSTIYAEQLGIPKTKWIYALGGAGTQDADNCETPASLPEYMCEVWFALLTLILLVSLGTTQLPFKSSH